MLEEIEALVKGRFDPDKVRTDLLAGFKRLREDDKAFGKRFVEQVGDHAFDLKFYHVTVSLFDPDGEPFPFYAYLSVDDKRGFPIGSYTIYYDEMGSIRHHQFSFDLPCR